MKIVDKYRIYKINFWHLKVELYEVSDGSACDPLKSVFLCGTMWHYALRDYWQPIIKSYLVWEFHCISWNLQSESFYINKI